MLTEADVTKDLCEECRHGEVCKWKPLYEAAIVTVDSEEGPFSLFFKCHKFKKDILPYNPFIK